MLLRLAALSNDKIVFKPKKEVNYYICVKVKDQDKHIDKKYLTLTAIKAPAVTLTTPAVIEPDKPFDITINVNGDASGYKFAVYIRKQGTDKWTTLGDYSHTVMYTCQPLKEGNYEICIKVKDSEGNISKHYYLISVKEAFTNISTVSAKKVNVGGTVQVTCAAKGGNAPYQYSVLYKKSSDTAWAVVQDYSENDKVNIKLSKQATYNILVRAKDNFDNISEETFDVSAVNSLDVSVDAPSRVAPGETFVIKFKAEGGVAPYTYALFRKKSKDTVWSQILSYSDSIRETLI